MTEPGLDAAVAGLIRDRLCIEVSDHGADLIAQGLIDSLALVTLITAIEDWLACELPLEDFDLDCFRSVTRIAAYLRARGVVGARDVAG